MMTFDWTRWHKWAKPHNLTSEETHITSLAWQDGYTEGRKEGLEEAATVALEQRCERGTPFDLACTTIAAAIRGLTEKP